MRIGIFFNVSRHTGGVYQYALAMVEAVSALSGHEVTIFTTTDDLPKRLAQNSHIHVVRLVGGAATSFDRVKGVASTLLASALPYLAPFLYKHNLFSLVVLPEKWSQQPYVRAIDESKLDYMIYPSSSNLAYLAHVPAVVAIHDLQHRLNPQFPEVSAGGHWELREYNFTRLTLVAKRILVDSKIGKEDVLNCYPGTDPGKIVVLPFLPPSYLEVGMTKGRAAQILRPYKITTPYFYYPANFWSHKHHLDLIEALHRCQGRGENYSLVFTGSRDVDYSTFTKVVDLATKYHLKNQVKYLGYVDSKTISALYRNATSLVMPTHFGPTNIPVLEAWAMGTPVIYSNVRGCREQLGDAGIAVTPDNSTEIAAAMNKMASDKGARARYIALGRKRLQGWTESDFSHTVRQMIATLE